MALGLENRIGSKAISIMSDKLLILNPLITLFTVFALVSFPVSIVEVPCANIIWKRQAWQQASGLLAIDCMPAGIMRFELSMYVFK